MASNNKTTDSTIASEAQNDKLSHPKGGVTTRDDALDAGVPMLQGTEGERQGPEDALGAGNKRGDYTGRIGDSNYHPHETVVVTDAKPGEATTVMVEQRPRAAEIGDDAGKKGGVETG